MARSRSLHVPLPTVEAPSAASVPLCVAVAAEDPARLARIASPLRSRGIRLATTATSPDEIVSVAGDCDVIALGWDLTAPSSAARLRAVRESLRPTPLTVVSPALTPMGIRRAIDAGVEGLVLEEDVDRALVPTLLSVAAGQVSVPREAGPQLQGPALTSRERQVLRMVAQGFKNFEIGQQLFLAESTVKSHLSSAFTKLGVRSRSEAAALILDDRAARELLSVAPER
jgi:DNA-binding NarL/FixJ family response regulator